MKYFLIKSSPGMQRGRGLLFSHCDLKPKGWCSKRWSNFPPHGECRCGEEQRPWWDPNKGKRLAFSDGKGTPHFPFDKPSLLAFLTPSRFFKFSCGLLMALITQKALETSCKARCFWAFFHFFFFWVSIHTSATFIMNLAVLGIRNAIIMIKDASVRKWISETRHSC